MHYFSDLFDKVLYPFRTGPLSIIRNISTLYICNMYLSCSFCWRLLAWSWPHYQMPTETRCLDFCVLLSAPDKCQDRSLIQAVTDSTCFPIHDSLLILPLEAT